MRIFMGLLLVLVTAALAGKASLPDSTSKPVFDKKTSQDTVAPARSHGDSPPVEISGPESVGRGEKEARSATPPPQDKKTASLGVIPMPEQYYRLAVVGLLVILLVLVLLMLRRQNRLSARLDALTLTMKALRDSQVAVPKQAATVAALPTEPFDRLSRAVVEQSQRQEQQLRALREKLSALSMELGKLIGETMAVQTRQLAHEMSIQIERSEQVRTETQRRTDVAAADAELRKLEETGIVRIARLTEALLLKFGGLPEAERAELADRYRDYVGLWSTLRRAKEFIAASGRESAENWPASSGRIKEAFAALKEAARRLADEHRPALFCLLLDKAYAVRLSNERGELMALLDVEELRPSVGEIVPDDSQYTLAAPARGEGRDIRIVKVEECGYRTRKTCTVLRKPKVVIELTTAARG